MKFSEVVFLDVIDVEEIHARAIEQFGGSEGVRDMGLLDSAVMSVQQSFGGAPLYDSLASMAAALGYSVAKNHAFIDGNKRAAAISVLTFLEVNGFPLVAPELEWASLFTRIAEDAAFGRERLAAEIVKLIGSDVEIEADD